MASAGAVSIGQSNLAALSRPDLVAGWTRVEVNMIQLGRVLTDAAMDPPIRACSSGTATRRSSPPTSSRCCTGWRRDDLFTVVHDQFMTDTARYADIVLPATTMLEHPDLVGSWGFSYLSWNEAVIEPIGESKSNAEVDPTARSPARLHRGGVPTRRSPADGTRTRRLTRGRRRPRRRHASRGRFHACRVHRRAPPSRRDATFAFSSDALAAAGLHPVAEYRPPANRPTDASRYPLRLLTLKRHYSINSSYGNLPVMLNAEPVQSCEIHPDDAAAPSDRRR